MFVKKIMQKPIFIEKDMSLFEAAKLMDDKGIGSLLFVQKGKVIGILTERDLLKHFGQDLKVSAVMKKDIVTVREEDNVDKALTVMKQLKIRRLPVVNENEKLIGIITLSDLAKNLISEDFFFE